MKKFLVFILSLALAVVAAPAMAMHAQTSVGNPAGGVVNSRHNFSSSGVHWRTGDTTTDARTTDLANGLGTTEICVFCHTPHHGRSDTAPLWNKDTGAVTFTAFTPVAQGGSTIGGTVFDQPSGSSLACLSCHDGAGTFDNIINAPGKGTFDGSGWTSGISNDGYNFGWEFTEDGTSGGDDHSNTTTTRHNLGRGPGLTGKNLANDHPISVSYNGEGSANPRASLRPTSDTISTINLNTEVQGDTMVKADGGDGNNLWAVAGFISDTAKISDLLRGGQIECSSCHDPHYKNQTNPEIDVTYGSTAHPTTAAAAAASDSDGLFLRRVGGNSDSGVCRTCHNK
ncbi:MAG: hypothetical protein ACE5IH_07085 [Thermodesulfobacteriota bacterium]